MFIRILYVTLQSFSPNMSMGKFAVFNLPLKTLSIGTHEFDYHLDKQFFANMEYADAREADIDVHLTVTLRNDIYVLHFKVTGTLTMLCDRCLDDMVVDVDAQYDINVEYGDDYNDESDDLLIIPVSDNYLNVSYMIYDTVVLALPIKHVHPMGKCNRQMSALLKKHRATISAEDLDLDEDSILEEVDEESVSAPTDPRWAALKGLGSNSSEN